MNILEDLSFYQVLIEQRDQIAEYRNESRKRARHAIFTCFAPGANSACWSLSSHAQVVYRYFCTWQQGGVCRESASIDLR